MHPTESHAERLTDLLLEQLDWLDLTEHEDACVLAHVALTLCGRIAELGELIESEARDLDDHSALQMATVMQAHSETVTEALARLIADTRFGLLPSERSRKSLHLGVPPFRGVGEGPREPRRSGL